MNSRFNIPIKVINLESSKDRRHSIEKQLKMLDLNYEILAAFDGSSLSEADLSKYSSKESLKTKGRELSRGEIACALSHIGIWEQVIDEDHEYVLILEDDALIGRALTGILSNIDCFPEDWEYINFVTDWEVIPFGQPFYDIYRMARIKGISNGSVVYLINRKGAKRLLKSVFPLRLPVDDYVGRTKNTGLKLYSIYPQAASRNEFRSDIWKKSERRNLKTTLSFKLKVMLAKVIRLLHIVKNRY